MAASSRLDSVIALARHRGFVFQAGEIYGGSRSAWDYGPLGVELKENIKRQWWKYMVTRRDDVVGLDSSVILPKRVWEASGHVGVFTDPLVECLSCHKRFREDHMLEAFEEKKGRAPENGMLDIACPNCGTRGEWTPPRDFNMMLKTYLGPVEDESGMHYLRPETAQGIFVNFANVLQAARIKPAVRRRPDRQVVPQRDHTGKLHLPHPRVRADGNRVLRRAGLGRRLAPVLDRLPLRLVHAISASTPRTCACSSTRRRSCRTTRSAPSTSSTSSASSAATGASSRASPTAPTSTSPPTLITQARTCPSSTRVRTNAGFPTSSNPRPA